MSALQGHDISPTTDPEEERQQRVLGQFYNYPFSSDDGFRQGLSGILARETVSQMSEDERSELILKTKVFYFNRVTGHNISVEDVQARYTVGSHRFHAESGNECSQTSSEAAHGELTFAELKRLIEQGKTDGIPHNKIIPNTLNDGVPSESTAPARRKPWEVASQS